MLFGISGKPVPTNLPYAMPINQACTIPGRSFPPCLVYAIAWRETIFGQTIGLWNASTVVSGDGGHGLLQLTSSFPAAWQDPSVNIGFAIQQFLMPDLIWWTQQIPGIQGDDLVRCVAASFNAGREGAWRGHMEGNVDKYTTGGDRGPYAADVLNIYHNLVMRGAP